MSPLLSPSYLRTRDQTLLVNKSGCYHFCKNACLTFPRLYDEEWELYGTDRARGSVAGDWWVETRQMRNTQWISASFVHRQALRRTLTAN